MGHGERKILQLKDGQVVGGFNSIKEAAISLNLQQSNIGAVIRKRSRLKSTGGFTFEYVSDKIDGEVWKQHPKGFLVSNFGRIEFKSGLRSYGSKQNRGYMHVNYKKTKYLVHRLVLEAFVGSCPENMECDHIDRNRTNNHLTNLRWVTRSENNRNK